MNSLQAKSWFIISYLRGIYHHNFQARANINSPPMKDDKNVEYLSHNYWYVELWIGHGQVLCLEWAHKSPFYNIMFVFFCTIGYVSCMFWGTCNNWREPAMQAVSQVLGPTILPKYRGDCIVYIYTYIWSTKCYCIIDWSGWLWYTPKDAFFRLLESSLLLPQLVPQILKFAVFTFCWGHNILHNALRDVKVVALAFRKWYLTRYRLCSWS